MITLYGGGPSQPTRAVWWACLIKQLPFELRVLGMGDVGPDSRFRKVNPVGQTPAIDDAGFKLAEMPAILCYLSDAHGWNDFYPAELQARALVNQYLHFHHNFTRQATFQLMGSHVTVAFIDVLEQIDKPAVYGPLIALTKNPDKLAIGQQVVDGICEHIVNAYFLEGAPYLCGDHPTLADITCYQELAQLRMANLYHFDNFPTVSSWLDKMALLPYHDVAHCYNLTLGDISMANPNTMERYMAASEASVAALVEVGISVAPL